MERTVSSERTGRGAVKDSTTDEVNGRAKEAQCVLPSVSGAAESEQPEPDQSTAARRNSAEGCPICGALFDTEPSLTRHIKTHFVCGRAAEDTGSANTAGVVAEPSHCPVCSMNFTDDTKLASHVDSHFTEAPVASSSTSPPATTSANHRCPLCCKSFADWTSLGMHASSCSGRVAAEAKPCPVCSATYTDGDELARHVEFHFSEKTAAAASGLNADHYCPVCSVLFADLASLSTHMATHHRNGCESDQSSTVAAHSVRTPGNGACDQPTSMSRAAFSPVQCRVCGASFYGNRLLGEHMETHRHPESQNTPSTAKVAPPNYGYISRGTYPGSVSSRASCFAGSAVNPIAVDDVGDTESDIIDDDVPTSLRSSLGSGKTVNRATSMRGLSSGGAEDVGVDVHAGPPAKKAMLDSGVRCDQCNMQVPLLAYDDHLAAHELDEEQKKEDYTPDLVLTRTFDLLDCVEDSDKKKAGQKGFGAVSNSGHHPNRVVHVDTETTTGVDTNRSATPDVVEAYRRMTMAAPPNNSAVVVSLCRGVTHYAGERGDRGWGCGYRNLQMMISGLMSSVQYRQQIVKTIGHLRKNEVPSIQALQSLIEAAWKAGYDVVGGGQLGMKLCNTKKWIGATEIAAVLRYLGIHAKIVDFHQPSCPSGTHPELFGFVKTYFSRTVDSVGEATSRPKTSLSTAGTGDCGVRGATRSQWKSTGGSSVATSGPSSSSAARRGGLLNGRSVAPQVHIDDDKFPIYLQYHGHSKTIIGMEQRHDNTVLIIIDPSHSKLKMASILSSGNGDGRGGCGMSGGQQQQQLTSFGFSSGGKTCTDTSSRVAAPAAKGRANNNDQGRLDNLRTRLYCLKSKQYQAVYVDGLVKPADAASVKLLTSKRVP